MAFCYFSSRHQNYTRLSEMKTIISAVISIAFLMGAPVFLMERRQSAFALTQYQSGFKHGVADAKDSCLHPDGCHWYTLEPGKGFAFHTKQIVKGYVIGFGSISPNTSSDADQVGLVKRGRIIQAG